MARGVQAAAGVVAAVAPRMEYAFAIILHRQRHAFSSDSLHELKSVEIEDGIWAAIQILEEQIDLTERVARRAVSQGNEDLGNRMQQRAQRYRERADLVRGADGRRPIVDSEVRSAFGITR